jgi:hypothetical protein
MISVQYLNDGGPEQVGVIPLWLNPLNPKSAKEQIDDAYQHGGGWDNFNADGTDHSKFELLDNNNLHYKGDPALQPRAKMQLRDETIYVYDHAWVAIVQLDRSFEVSRID